MKFDLIVLGGGPAGYLAASRAGHAGLSVALVEERELGGVCLNEGCIPTKTLLYSAKLYDGVKHGERFGISAEGLSIDHLKVVRRKNKVVKVLVAGVKAKLKAANVTVYSGRGRIAKRDAEGFLVVTDEVSLVGDRLLLATGSSPALPPIPGLKEALGSGFALTNREVLDLQEVPQHLCIIGGGVIGLEFATYFGSLGSEVTVIEMLDHLAGETDQELVANLKGDLEKKGIRFLLGAKVTALEEGTVRFEQAGEALLAEADKVLLSIGRRPNTAGLGLEELGVLLERGAVKTDNQLRTNVPGLWAAGDVNGRSMLAHTAYREAEVAVADMLGQEDRIRYDTVPAVLYTSPEIASVGLTQAAADREGIPFRLIKLPLRYSGRYLAENEAGNGVMKLLVDPDSQRVLGAHFLCNYSSEFIVAVCALMELGATVPQIQKLVFPHPTVAEILHEAVFHTEDSNETR